MINDSNIKNYAKTEIKKKLWEPVYLYVKKDQNILT